MAERQATRQPGMTPTRTGPSTALRTELVWPGKHTQVERVALPFQVVETVNQSRAHQPALSPSSTNPGGDGWTNKLVWGDNKYIMASLLQGDPSIGLERLAGKIDLIYIDPPFATGQDFSYQVRVGDEEWVKEASIIEETAYRDTWGRGLDSYLQIMYERLLPMHDLLADDGSVYVHLDDTVVHYVKAIMDEIFGELNFRNEVIYQRAHTHNDPNRYGRIHDTLLFYTKSEAFNFNVVRGEYREEYLAQAYRHADKDGRRYRILPLHAPQGRPQDRQRRFGDRVLAPPPGKFWRWSQNKIDEALEQGLIVMSPRGVPGYKKYLEQAEGVAPQSLWTDLYTLSQEERTLFPTQKPEALLERIIKASSNEGDLVADLFSGSGTTMAVAEKLGRRWIGCDLSRYAVQVSRKRLLDIPGCKPFQVLNLGKYERKHWQVNVMNGHQEQEKAIADYLRFIVALYHADPSTGSGGYTHLHGQKAGRWVHVGATDAPVTRSEVMDAVRECQAHRYTGLDALGWEWEMGLHDTIREEARRMGVDVRLLVIPREVMDRRAVQAGDVHFYELAYLKTSLVQDRRTVTVRLEDFIIPNVDLVPDEVRGKIKKWSDYIDFWAVDWDYQGDAFHNQWQTYRTRKSPTLRLVSDPHTYERAGSYKVLVKVIDIFGNDTTQLLEVKAP